MQAAHDVSFDTVTGLVRRLRDRELSPVELLDACLARIREVDPQVNAFVEVLEPQARAEAEASASRLQRGEGRPLEGVPIPIKDNTPVLGARVRHGSAMAPTAPATYEAVLVQRLRQAGAVILGKTNLPEFGTIASTERGVDGDTHNPWDLSRTPGGSSGGAAAAVATGMAPAAHGNDGGGSLRVPASCCGLYTIKPTRGRVSRAPEPDSPGGLVVDGFLTRSVADQALLLDLCSGRAPGDLSWAPPPARPFADAVGAQGRPLRIAWTLEAPLDVVVFDGSERAVRETASLCEELGHHVEQVTPPWRSDDLVVQFIQGWAAGIGSEMEYLADLGGDIAVTNPHNRALYELQKQFTPARVLVTLSEMQRFARKVMLFWEDYDVVLSPVLSERPLILGELFEHEEADPLYPLNRCGIFCAFTPLINVTGQPAASLPMLWTDDGLPVGVQAIGRTAQEDTLLRLSAQLEEARPWRDRRPPL